MTTITVAELATRLGEFLTKVKAGEEFVVTDEGKPIAWLSPAAVAGERESLLRLARAGRINLKPGQPLAELWDKPRPYDPGAVVLRALLEQREEGR